MSSNEVQLPDSKNNISTKSNFFLLYFEDKRLESSFLDFYYGSKRSWRMISVFVVFYLFNLLAIVSDLLSTGNNYFKDFPNNVRYGNWVFIGLTIVQWVILPIGSIIHFWKKAWRIRLLVEIYWVLFTAGIYVAGMMIVLDEDKLSINVIRYEKGVLFGIAAVLRIRFFMGIFTQLIIFVLYSTFICIVGYGTYGSDGRLFVSLFSEFVNCLLVLLFSRNVEKLCRSIFLAQRSISMSGAKMIEENKRTETFLENIFPKVFVREIQNDIKVNNNPIIFHQQYGAILLADLKGFTSYCSGKTSQSIVMTLNDYFLYFDLFSLLFGVTKVCSIGDAVLMVSNMEENDVKLNIQTMCLYAVACISTINSRIEEPLPIRSGIEIGEYLLSCHGSVSTALNFSLFSKYTPTVTNLESSARDNSIHLSSNCVEFIEDDFRLLNENDGSVSIVWKEGTNLEDLVLEGSLVTKIKEEISKVKITSGRIIATPKHDGKNEEEAEEEEEEEENNNAVVENAAQQKQMNLRSRFKSLWKRIISMKLKSPEGLIYPLLLFSSKSDEMEYVRETVTKNSSIFIYESSGGILLTLNVIFYFVFTFKFSHLSSTFMIYTYFQLFYVCIFLIVSFLSFIFQKLFLVWLLWGLSLGSTIIFFVQTILANTTVFDSSVSDLYVFIGSFFCSYLIVAMGLHPLIRLSFGLASILTFVIGIYTLHLEEWEEVAEEHPIYTPSDGTYVFGTVMISVFMIFATCIMEWFERQGYVRKKRLKKTYDSLREEVNLNKFLLSSILPLNVIEEIERFSDIFELRDNLVMYKLKSCYAFIQIQGFDDLLNVEPNVAKEKLKAVFSIFDVFDQIIKRNQCRKVKIFQGSYFFISENFTDEGQSVRGCLNAALDCSDRSILPLLMGCCWGEVSGGLIGVTRLMYDCLGDAINLASRLSTSSEKNRMQMLQSQVERFGLGEEYHIIERGAVDLKGKGEMSTCFVSKRID